MSTRGKAEELALRRAQLERRQKRLAAAQAQATDGGAEAGMGVGRASVGVAVSASEQASGLGSSGSGPPPSPSLTDISYGKQPPYTASMVEAGIPPIPAVLEARERALRMARNELEMMREAREKAELNAAKMCEDVSTGARGGDRSAATGRDAAQGRGRVYQEGSHTDVSRRAAAPGRHCHPEALARMVAAQML